MSGGSICGCHREEGVLRPPGQAGQLALLASEQKCRGERERGRPKESNREREERKKAKGRLARLWIRQVGRQIDRMNR